MSANYLRKIFLVFCLSIWTGCREELARNLNDRELRKIVGALAEAGIDSGHNKQSDNLWTLEVDRNNMVQAMQIIDQYRLLDEKPIEEKESSLFVSEQEQRLRYQQSIAQQIENTIKTLDGVMDSKVMVTLPQTESMLGHSTTERGSSSVLIIGSVDLMTSTEEIQELVSGAVGIPVENIHVLMKSGRPPSIQTHESVDKSFPRGFTATCGAVLCAAGALLLIRKTAVKKDITYDSGIVTG